LAGGGPQIDIWSLGITCIELAVGNAPMHELHYMKAMIEIPKRPPPQLEGSYSPEFKAFVARCLVKNPQQRATAAELLEDPWLKGKPVDKRALRPLLDRLEANRQARSSQLKAVPLLLYGPTVAAVLGFGRGANRCAVPSPPCAWSSAGNPRVRRKRARRSGRSVRACPERFPGASSDCR